MASQNNCYYFQEEGDGSPRHGFYVSAPSKEDARKHLAKRLSVPEPLTGFFSFQVEKDAIPSLRLDIEKEGVCRSVKVAVMGQG